MAEKTQSSERMVVVSGDGHAGPPPEVYRDYIEKRFHGAIDDLVVENEEFLEVFGRPSWLRPEVLEVIDDRRAVRSGGTLGYWDVKHRLAELDREGVALELVFPLTQFATMPFFHMFNKPQPPELRDAGARAYCRWLADFVDSAGGRLLGVPDVGPCLDMDATVADLHWMADRGFKTVQIPGHTGDPDLPPLYDAYYEPFWAACAELDLVLNIHVSYGKRQGVVWNLVPHLQAERRRLNNPHLALLDLRPESLDPEKEEEYAPSFDDIIPRNAMWQIMCGGVFDRYPSLKLAVTEIRGDWVPASLAYLDARFAAGDIPVAMKLKPSEYFERHCFMGLSFIHRAEVETRHDIGLAQMMFGRDYPHNEGTWPNTWDWIRAAFVGCPEGEARQILGENAIRCYGLDRDELAAIARHIGPRPEDILGDGPEVDPRKIEHFHKRGGFSKPVQAVDTSFIDEELAAIATAQSGT